MARNNTNYKKVYSAQEAADILGIHKNTVYVYAKEGKIKHSIIGRKIKITAEEIERIIREGMKH